MKRGVEERYKGSFLGIVWSIAQPLMMLAVYTFVFSTVLKAKTMLGGAGDNIPFSLFLLCGMAVFGIFSESVNASCATIICNQNLVKKVVFPLEVLPASKVFSTIILNLIWFVLLFLGMLVFVHKLYWTMLLLPLILIPLTLMTLGFSFMAASLSVYIRDCQYLIGVLLQVMFFMSPVFYSLQNIPDKPVFGDIESLSAVTFRSVLQLNPLATLIDLTRKFFLVGELPSAQEWCALGWIMLFSLLVCHLGIVWFAKTKKGFADVL